MDRPASNGCLTSSARQAIVRGMVAICRDLEMKVLAEGIETPAERDTLRGAGIDLMQGYLLCRPASRAAGVIDPGAWGRRAW